MAGLAADALAFSAASAATRRTTAQLRHRFVNFEDAFAMSMRRLANRASCELKLTSMVVSADSLCKLIATELTATVHGPAA